MEKLMEKVIEEVMEEVMEVADKLENVKAYSPNEREGFSIYLSILII